ncbi:MAG: transporter family er 28, partial [Methylobacterium sp.]|nr:transporter family er 28 [Methylobacterium sp.]
MDRDPIAFTWRTARGEHAAAVGLALGLGGPLALLALLCLRDLVGVQVHDTEPVGQFLRVAATLPWRAAGGPFVAFAGWTLPPAELVRAALLGLAAAAVASAGLGWAVARLCFRAQARTVAALQGRVTEAILRAPPSARDEARALAQTLGEVLARLDTLFGLAILVPALAIGSAILALALAGMAA